MVSSAIKFGLAVLVVSSISGCVLNRSVVDVPTGTNVENPSSGTAIKLLPAVDKRVFEVDPPKPEIPSLRDNDIGNKSLTSRAIARKRNGFGAAVGDVVLDEGNSVSSLVTAKVAEGLRRGGFRVGDDGAETKVSIEKFWVWVNPGAFQIYCSCEAEVTIESPALKAPVKAAHRHQSGHAILLDSTFVDTAAICLNGLAQDIELKLQTSQ